MKELAKRLWAKRWLKWTSIILAVMLLGYWIFGGTAAATYETVAVARGTVSETVTATGQIKPKSYASLRFKTTGTIARLNVDVGDTVAIGQVLASIDTSDLARRVTQSEADATAARVSLANADQGVLDAETKGAQALSVLYADAPNKFNTILNLSQQAYASFVAFYDGSNHLTTSIRNVILDSQKITNADNYKVTADAAMVKINAELEGFPINASQSRIDSALANIDKPLQDLQAAISALVNAIAAIPTGSLAAATLETYKSTLSTAQTNTNSAISSEVTLTSNIHDAKVQNNLNLNTAKATQRSASAEVAKANAALSIAQQNLSDAYLRAPIAGTVGSKSKQIGELVTTADQVFYLLGTDSLEVISNVPEVDVARLKVGMAAVGTLDALSPDEKFDLVIESIDPDQTTIDGVVYYRTHFVFKNADARFKSGMSVNLTLTTTQKEGVLVIPRRAVTQRAGTSTVKLAPAKEGASPVVRDITVGLKGDMLIEVLSGLVEGEKVITGEKK